MILHLSPAATMRLPGERAQLDQMVRDAAADPTVLLDPLLRDQVAHERAGVLLLRFRATLSAEAHAALTDIASRSFVPVAVALEWMLLRHERGENFNEETRSVLRNSGRGVDVARFDSAAALFEDLEFDEPGEAR